MNPVAWLISIPLASSPLIYLTGHAAANRWRTPAANGRTSWWISLVIVAAMWVSLLWATLELQTGVTLTLAVGGLALHVDGLSLLMAVLALSVSTLVILYSRDYYAERSGAEKYYAMLMATTGTLIGMVCARDLFNLWIWFEAMVMASFLLVSFYGKRPASLDASVKYLVQSAIGSFLILLGIALVLAQTGTLALDHLQQGTLSPILLAAGALFLIGFGIKSALVPMHTWLPDAYAESPSTITALLSGAVTVSGLIALARVLAPLAGAVLSWGLLLMVFGAINMLVGNLLALRQQDVKRLLAYSSISHIGYIVLGLGIGIYTGQAGAAQGGLFHALTTGAMETLAFLAVGALLFSLGKAEDRDRPLTIAGLQGLLHRYPLPSFALVLAVLSLGGIPPLAGFMSKWQIFVSGFAIEDPLVRSLIVFAGLNALLSMAYYLPVTISLCRHDTIETAPTRLVLPSLMRLPLIILIAIILIVGIWPDLARGLTGAASAALINAFHLGGGL